MAFSTTTSQYYFWWQGHRLRPAWLSLIPKGSYVLGPHAVYNVERGALNEQNVIWSNTTMSKFGKSRPFVRYRIIKYDCDSVVRTVLIVPFSGTWLWKEKRKQKRESFSRSTLTQKRNLSPPDNHTLASFSLSSVHWEHRSPLGARLAQPLRRTKTSVSRVS